MGADVVDGDGHLAVGLLAQGATVLALHADGMLALLGETGVVDDENALRALEGLGHAGPVAAQDGLLVPGALIDELLQGLFGVLTGQALGQGNAAGQRFDALALPVEQQSLQIDASPAGGLGLREIRGKQRGVVAEAAKHSRIEFRSIRLHTRLDAGILNRDSSV